MEISLLGNLFGSGPTKPEDGAEFKTLVASSASKPGQFVDRRETAAEHVRIIQKLIRDPKHSVGSAAVAAAANLIRDAKSSGLTLKELKVLEPLVQRSLAEAKQEILDGKLSPAQRQTMQDSLASFAKAVAPDLPLGRSYLGATEMMQSIPGANILGTAPNCNAMLDEWGSQAAAIARLNERGDL